MKRIMRKLLTPAMAALCLLMASMPLRAFDEVSPQSGVITFADADGAALVLPALYTAFGTTTVVSFESSEGIAEYICMRSKAARNSSKLLNLS